MSMPTYKILGQGRDGVVVRYHGATSDSEFPGSFRADLRSAHEHMGIGDCVWLTGRLWAERTN